MNLVPIHLPIALMMWLPAGLVVAADPNLAGQTS
jgi:hypothetical protein